MSVVEKLGMDPIWQRIVLPATACLRLGILAAVAAAPVLHIDLAAVVDLVAVAVGIAYVAAYGAVWLRWLPPYALGLSALLDGLLVGALVGGAGGQAPLVGFLGLLVLVLAHMSGGMRLVAAVGTTLLAGWAVSYGLGIGDLAGPGAWRNADFRFALEPETAFRGDAVLALSDGQFLRAALGVLLLVSASGCAAFARATWERRRVARACAEIGALEEIVDCYASGASEEELWRTIADSASLVAGVPAFVACASADGIRFVAVAGTPGDGISSALRSVQIPASRSDNPVIQCIAGGQETEASGLNDLTRGATVGQGSLPEDGRKYRCRIIPIPGEEAALVALAIGRSATEGLRMVAERSALVRRARHDLRRGFDLDPIAAGA